MSDLPAAGAEAPAFSLTDRQGSPMAFDGDARGATLLFFFKHDCATCELTAPLVERLHRALGPLGLRVAGVSQDPDADTAGFVDRHGLSFDVALDADLAVSADYGFDAVPALV
ncbi:MAG: TlpA disulfide reductase family protein, partial [Acidobacteria bacterium]|nr:TlpA disulfide reductase family protein [Acidobacteriota bacterium]